MPASQHDRAGCRRGTQKPLNPQARPPGIFIEPFEFGPMPENDQTGASPHPYVSDGGRAPERCLRCLVCGAGGAGVLAQTLDHIERVGVVGGRGDRLGNPGGGVAWARWLPGCVRVVSAVRVPPGLVRAD
jgi:hypothetical protein